MLKPSELVPGNWYDLRQMGGVAFRLRFDRLGQYPDGYPGPAKAGAPTIEGVAAIKGCEIPVIVAVEHVDDMRPR